MIMEVTGHGSSVLHIYEHPKIKQQKDVSSVIMSSNDKENHPVTLTDQHSSSVHTSFKCWQQLFTPPSVIMVQCFME